MSKSIQKDNAESVNDSGSCMCVRQDKSLVTSPCTSAPWICFVGESSVVERADVITSSRLALYVLFCIDEDGQYVSSRTI